MLIFNMPDSLPPASAEQTSAKPLIHISLCWPNMCDHLMFVITFGSHTGDILTMLFSTVGEKKFVDAYN